jgi:hypothetical protein
MGLFDELGTVLKHIGEAVKKSDPDNHLNNGGQELNRAGRDISAEAGRAGAPNDIASPAPSAPVAARPSGTSTGRSASRSPHPGYVKIAAWMKRNYKNRITGSCDTFQQGLQLEQLTAEACSGLSEKTRKGFMDYLKKQNYEPLLR